MSPTRPAASPVFLLCCLLAGPLARSAPSRAPEESGEGPVVVIVDPGAPPCAGLWARACPEQMRCVDDPRDPCDERYGGSDCLGVCVEDRASRPDPSCLTDSPGRRYVSHAPPECLLLRFTCDVHEKVFSDPCGCGCEQEAVSGD